jgi:hypothetical protein
MQKVYENDGKVFAKYLQHNYPQLYSQGVWIFGDCGQGAARAWRALRH